MRIPIKIYDKIGNGPFDYLFPGTYGGLELVKEGGTLYAVYTI